MPPDISSAGGHSLAAQRQEQGSAQAGSQDRPADYQIYGLRVRSELDLPGWPVAPPGAPDVVIRKQSVIAPTWDGEPYTARAGVESGEFLLTVSGVARYAARGGSVILVDPEAGARGEDLRLYLTGVMMGTILHQRGTLPLHASCVVLPGSGGVGFAGRSGAGKSTLVAALVRRGAAFVSDDLCVIAAPLADRLEVWPGAARLKLDEAGLGPQGRPAAALEPAGGNRGKYHLPVEAPFDQTSPVPFDRLYLLTDGVGPPRAERLSGLDAVSALVDQTYFLAYAHALGLTSQVFRLAAAVARSLPVFRLVRPRGLDHLPEVAALAEGAAARGER